MIEFKNVGVRRDGRLLFADAGFQLFPKQKIGLTGNNGTGKSTLFAVLLGDLEVDSGDVLMPSAWQIAHMAQEVEASDQTALDYVLSGDEEWFLLNQSLQNQATLTPDAISRLHQRFEEIDGYRTEAKAAQILTGLGFAQNQHDWAVKAFSGGWRMRLNLAKTLMKRADLLLLDEPTNHLDLDAILWLESWIAQFDGLVLLISHDQAFLDATVDHILHIENQNIQLYSGNYSQFIKTRSERLAQQQQAYEKQQATKAHLEKYIRRFRAKASKAKQAQSRIKQLERMVDLSPVMAENLFSFEFYPPEYMGSPLLVLDKASVGYDGNVLLQNIQIQLTPDSRLGLLGVNGAGKSTLIKAMVGDLPLISGQYRLSNNTKIGYFNQHQMDILDADATPLLMLRRLAKNTTSDADLRAFLGRFGFQGDRIDTPSRLFSGGERARLTLALIVWQRPNLLILDEPTNHLDLQMRQALTYALQDFLGAVVLVSHDRTLLADVCDELYLVHQGKVTPFDGDIQDYSEWLKNSQKSKQEPQKNAPNARSHSMPTHKNSEKSPEKKQSKEDKRKQAAEHRKRTAPLRKRIEHAEKQLETQQTALAQIETQLSDASLYDDARKNELLALLNQQSQHKQALEIAEEELLAAMSELEEMEQMLKNASI